MQNAPIRAFCNTFTSFSYLLSLKTFVLSIFSGRLDRFYCGGGGGGKDRAVSETQEMVFFLVSCSLVAEDKTLLCPLPVQSN